MAFNFDAVHTPLDVESGEWVSDLPGHPMMRLKVRSFSYAPFFDAYNDLQMTAAEVGGDYRRSDEFKSSLGELMAKHLLLDWEHAWVHDGKDMPYDPDAAMSLLTLNDPRGIGTSFRQLVMISSNILVERHNGVVEAISGNSEPLSHGSPPMAEKTLTRQMRRK